MTKQDETQYHYEEDVSPCSVNNDFSKIYPQQPVPGPNTFEWTIPDSWNTLTVQIIDEDDSLITEIVISDFFKLKPGHRIRGLAD